MRTRVPPQGHLRAARSSPMAPVSFMRKSEFPQRARADTRSRPQETHGARTPALPPSTWGRHRLRGPPPTGTAGATHPCLGPSCLLPCDWTSFSPSHLLPPLFWKVPFLSSMISYSPCPRGSPWCPPNASLTPLNTESDHEDSPSSSVHGYAQCRRTSVRVCKSVSVHTHVHMRTQWEHTRHAQNRLSVRLCAHA